MKWSKENGKQDKQRSTKQYTEEGEGVTLFISIVINVLPQFIQFTFCCQLISWIPHVCEL